MCYQTSGGLRFLLPTQEFVIARFFFSVTLIFFFVRLLRFGYITRALGPRIISIQKLVRLFCLNIKLYLYYIV